MARESLENKARRFGVILRRLCETYPDAHCELNYSNPLELLIATILSAQCTDKQVNIVTAGLFKKFKTAADYASTAPAEMEESIKAIGLFRNKARNIRSCCQRLVDRHGGQVPQTMEELTALDGVGRKTANVVLGNAFGKTEGVVVDTHVARLAERFGLVRELPPEKVESLLQKLTPREDWTMLSHWMIWHGRRRCYARSPDCAQCELGDICPSRRDDSKSTRSK